MSQEIRMSHRAAFGSMKRSALQVQSTTLGTLVHSRHSRLQLTLSHFSTTARHNYISRGMHDLILLISIPNISSFDIFPFQCDTRASRLRC